MLRYTLSISHLYFTACCCNMNQPKFHGNSELHRNCYLHPKEMLVGVCPLCLNERLLTLASLKQSHYNKHRAQQHRSSRGPSFSLSKKILALASLLSRFELQRHKTSSDYTSSSTTTKEDSFISIKFEDNGVAFWDKNNDKSGSNVTITEINKDSNEGRDNTKQLDNQLKWHANNESCKLYESNNTSSVIRRVRPQGAGTLRWRKRIGNIVDHIRWKIASKTNMGN